MRLLIVLSRGLKHQQPRRRTRRYTRTRQTHRQTMRLLLPTRAGAPLGGDVDEARTVTHAHGRTRTAAHAHAHAHARAHARPRTTARVSAPLPTADLAPPRYKWDMQIYICIYTYIHTYIHVHAPLPTADLAPPRVGGVKASSRTNHTLPRGADNAHARGRRRRLGGGFGWERE